MVGQDAIIRACRDLIRNFERKTYLLVTATVSWKYRVSLIDDRRRRTLSLSIDRPQQGMIISEVRFYVSQHTRPFSSFNHRVCNRSYGSMVWAGAALSCTGRVRTN